MKKRYIIIIILCFVASLAFLIITVGYNNAQSKKADELKSSNKALQSRIETSKQSKLQNSVLINKIDKDPNQLAKDAKKQAEQFVDVVNKNKGKADKDKQAAYKTQLEPIMSEDVRNSSDLTSIDIPKDYDMDVSTQRGDSVPVLISSNDRYIVVGYDAYAEEITSVKEYKKA